jgi:hypothetical protein
MTNRIDGNGSINGPMSSCRVSFAACMPCCTSARIATRGLANEVLESFPALPHRGAGVPAGGLVGERDPRVVSGPGCPTSPNRRPEDSWVGSVTKDPKPQTTDHYQWGSRSCLIAWENAESADSDLGNPVRERDGRDGTDGEGALAGIQASDGRMGTGGVRVGRGLRGPRARSAPLRRKFNRRFDLGFDAAGTLAAMGWPRFRTDLFSRSPINSEHAQRSLGAPRALDNRRGVRRVSDN